MIDIGTDQPGHSLRMLIAQALRFYKTENLYQFLEDKSSIVRSAAAREIQMRGERESYEYVMRLIGDRRAFVREVAIFILGQFGAPEYPYKKESIPILITHLSTDAVAAVRAAAAAALGHLKAGNAVDALAVASSDKSEEVRVHVAFALNAMKTRPKTREALRKLERDKSKKVRFWAKS